MLTTVERIAFLACVVIFGGITIRAALQGLKLLKRSRPAPTLKNIPMTMGKALIDIGLQKPIFKTRPLLSLFHFFIFAGFSFYLLVNGADTFEGFIPGFELYYGGRELVHLWPGVQGIVDANLINIFNLIADVLSVGVLVGMIAFLLRRLSGRDKRLKFNDDVQLNPKVAKGSIFRDSYIVGVWMLTHVGGRFWGQSLRLAREGEPDPFMPFATIVSNLWMGMDEATLNVLIHVAWWLALGTVIILLPYFIISKHVHLMAAPLNIGLGKQNPVGQLDPAVPEGTDLMPGAQKITDLAWPRILDAYSCIMCNRCNDVCPAHGQGRVLSPAALEINKRYFLNEEMFSLAGGADSNYNLVPDYISSEAVWACTTCYACVEICPVGNEPMADIIDIRRGMMMEGTDMDSGIQGALESLSKNGNWFNTGGRRRARWTKELEFDIKDVADEEAEYLWFVGDTASYDDRVTPLTQRVANIFHHAGVDFGILGKAERNSGNDVRRVGEEGLFEQLVEENMAAMEKGSFTKIVTTDPHSLNALRNEYPQYGGKWEVNHYTNVLLELFESGKLKLENSLYHYKTTYHDPCYLGRYNGGYSAPRKLLQLMDVQFRDMPRSMENSYCCGAGGGQIWIGTTPEGERPAENRIIEALETLGEPPHGEKLLFIVACPKDVIMYTDAVKTTGNEDKIEVRDIIQLVEEATGILLPEEPADMEEEAVPA